MPGMAVIGLVNESNGLDEARLLPGDLYELPLGLLHYYYNPTCQTVQFIGTFPLYSNTQFVLPALKAVPAPVMSTFYINGTLPPLQSFPFHTAASCQQNCTQPVIGIGTTWTPGGADNAAQG
eukprot:jgi/Chrzof1/6780/Cz19g09060.t1